MPVIVALRRLRKEGLGFKESLGCTVRSLSQKRTEQNKTTIKKGKWK
jgi:hypothetical protein